MLSNARTTLNTESPEMADLKYYAPKIIDNTLSSDELHIFYDRCKNYSLENLNMIVNGFKNYLDLAQLHRLCQKLMVIELERADVAGYMRNTSLSKSCVFALMNKLGFGVSFLDEFMQCQTASEFLERDLAIPSELASLFQQVFTLMPHTPKESLAEIFVFNFFTTIINNSTAKLEAIDAMRVMTSLKSAMKRDNPAYCRFLTQVYGSIINVSPDFTLPIQKSERDTYNDRCVFLYEIASKSLSDKNLLISWPTVFAKIQRTPAEEDNIQKTRSISILNDNLLILKSENVSLENISRILGDIGIMIDAILRHHPHWRDQELIEVVTNIFEFAKAKVQFTPQATYLKDQLLKEIDERQVMMRSELRAHLQVNVFNRE